jgi:DNA-binding response OmpR family regulator
MDGRQVAEAVHSRLPDMPVLFITGYAVTPLPPGAAVINKPFELDVLVQRVEAILKAGQHRRRGHQET